jgi:hypothetical protein
MVRHEIGSFVGLVMAMSILYPISRLIKGLVEDKESRMKETQKMMGLFQWVFMASWYSIALIYSLRPSWVCNLVQ